MTVCFEVDKYDGCNVCFVVKITVGEVVFCTEGL